MKRRLYRWSPCFTAHPETGRSCQLPRDHAGPHRCGYPGGVDRWERGVWPFPARIRRPASPRTASVPPETT